MKRNKQTISRYSVVSLITKGKKNCIVVHEAYQFSEVLVCACRSTMVRDFTSSLCAVKLVCLTHCLEVLRCKDITKTVPVGMVKAPMWNRILPCLYVHFKFLETVVPRFIQRLSVSFCRYGIKHITTTVFIFTFSVPKFLLSKVNMYCLLVCKLRQFHYEHITNWPKLTHVHNCSYL